jgi:hypothetical protein
MAGYQTNLTTGIAVLLADAGVASWSPTAAYDVTATGILLKVMPPEPDNAVTLSTYPVSDDPTLADTVTGLQVMTRAGGADPRPVDDLADAVFDQLQGLHDLTLSTGVRVVMVEHKGGSSLGQDDEKRWARVDNYYVTTYRPAPFRL